MVESVFWNYLKKGMGQLWLSDRIETGVTKAGVPDVFFTMEGRMGWIELKLAKKLPARDSSKIPVKISPLQVHWLQTRFRLCQGGTWLFIAIENPRCYYLIRGGDSQVQYTKSEIESIAFKTWRTKIDFPELAFILQNETLPVPA